MLKNSPHSHRPHKRDLGEYMAWRRILGHETKLEVVGDPVHNGIVRDESKDLHSTLGPGADHRVNIVIFLRHFGPSVRKDSLRYYYIK